MIINKLRMPIADARAIEDTKAKVAKQQALLEYVAIMSDIEIEEDDENEHEN